MKKALLGSVISHLFLRKAWPQLSGRIDGLPLHRDVRVARDAWGIPHITAGDEHDLYAALGFVHAQDRLWQMESLRRFTEGRLSEIAGEKTILADYHARMVGMPFMKREALGAMSPVELEHLQAYADGVNAYLGQRGRDLPLEFVSMGFTPEPWTPLDSTSLLPYMSWSLLLFHLFEELLALARGGSFTEKEWNDLFPVMPGAVLPKEPFFESLARRKVGALDPAALLFHAGLPDRYSAESMTKTLLAHGMMGGGSNNWAVARGDTGAPLLENDPHLGIGLPSVWYFCHLTVPGVLNAAGCSLAGAPTIVLGRNEHVAWGFTNLLLDACDTLLFSVDPANPVRYRIGGAERRMTKEDVADPAAEREIGRASPVPDGTGTGNHRGGKRRRSHSGPAMVWNARPGHAPGRHVSGRIRVHEGEDGGRAPGRRQVVAVREPERGGRGRSGPHRVARVRGCAGAQGVLGEAPRGWKCRPGLDRIPPVRRTPP